MQGGERGESAPFTLGAVALVDPVDLHAHVVLADSAGVSGVVAAAGQAAELGGGEQRVVLLGCRIEVMAPDHQDQRSQPAVERLWVNPVDRRCHPWWSVGS